MREFHLLAPRPQPGLPVICVGGDIVPFPDWYPFIIPFSASVWDNPPTRRTLTIDAIIADPDFPPTQLFQLLYNGVIQYTFNVTNNGIATRHSVLQPFGQDVTTWVLQNFLQRVATFYLRVSRNAF